MSYTGRHRYTRPEVRHERHMRNFKVAAVIITIALAVLIYKNRYFLREWVASVMT